MLNYFLLNDLQFPKIRCMKCKEEEIKVLNSQIIHYIYKNILASKKCNISECIVVFKQDRII